MLTLMPLYGQSQQSSPPLNPEEKRLILSQLYELSACRQTVLSYEDFFRRDKEQDARETANYQRALELEQQATKIAQRERDLQAERATFYENAFKSVTKKRGIGCTLKKVFTLGLARCG
jgi:uncharacterized protein YlxW (UPF0749 family)